MRMKNELRAAAGAAVVALLVAGCGSTPVPPPVMAHGVAAREPLVDPRPYGTADTALGLGLLSAYCRSDPGANTVASAATTVGAQASAARVMPPQVSFDRPYLMVATDRATGEPLFMARVADPTAR
jgi:hypothetical protein